MSDDELVALDEEFKLIHQKLQSSGSLHKLHEKIAAEHKRRLSYKDAAKVLNKINPLSSVSKNKDNN